MQSQVCINGVISDGGDARISVFDRGFLFADSVYEVLRTMQGRPLFWPEHAERLWGSAERIALDPRIAPAHLLAEVEATLARMPGECRVRIIITRGVGQSGLGLADAGQPSRVIICTPLTLPDPSLYTQGCGLKIVRTGRRDEGGLDPRAKSGSKLMAVLAQAEAEAAGFYEALRVDPLDRVLEGGTSTFFMVRDGAVLTPPLDVGILAGITRGKVLGVAERLGLPTQEEAFEVAALDDAAEAFITSSVRGVMPVSRIDHRGYRAPGPVTQQVIDGYAAMIARSISPT